MTKKGSGRQKKGSGRQKKPRGDKKRGLGGDNPSMSSRGTKVPRNPSADASGRQKKGWLGEDIKWDWGDNIKGLGVTF